MKITTLNQLLKNKNPQARAYVPEKVGKRQPAVNVVFNPDEKVYTYKGSILSVAEKLNLIPEVDIGAEAKEAISTLKASGSATAHVECSDTINHGLGMPGKYAQEVSRDKDEFDRVVVTFEVVENLWS